MASLKPKPLIPLSTFAYLFSEMVSYHQQHVDSLELLESRLHEAGSSIGLRYLELYAFRNPKSYPRDHSLMLPNDD